MKIIIIDYQLGNLFSVQQACLYLGFDAEISSDANCIAKADAIILPGVGAFADAMYNLQKFDLIEPIKDFVSTNKPFMGICLGLQLLFGESEEFGIHKGIGLIEGVVKKFPTQDTQGGKLKVPQIAWNTIFPNQKSTWDNSPLSVCGFGDYMYFVHSFYVQPAADEVVLSTTNYGGHTYCSSILKNNIFACQFHPEKSGLDGIKIYKNWLNNNSLT
ncbi:MAG: imidazole glycerol phosphate synthase subunit HisH [Bacteroidetes Order II. Incertae sedis bacterium]|nr:imidazole glycerol phosphate synthase subunit HisH [Bacteroidetes Order II. bacterium]